jgi:prepilin-type N-terminal cleavage/methylation domain-containing protein
MDTVMRDRKVLQIREGYSSSSLLSTNIYSRRGLKAVSFFTLVELLVVIAILAVLMSLLQPALTKFFYKAELVSCKSNLNQISLGTFMYAGDNNDGYPRSTSLRDYTYRIGAFRSDHSKNIIPLIEPYFGGTLNGTFMCPGAKKHPLWDDKQDYDKNQSNYNYNSNSSYPLYFNQRGIKQNGGSFPEKDAMSRLGEGHRRTKNGADVWIINIIASDMSHGAAGGAGLGGNHIPPGQIYYYKTNEYRDGRFRGSYDKFGPIIYDANFVLDDGSVVGYNFNHGGYYLRNYATPVLMPTDGMAGPRLPEELGIEE